MSYSDLLLCSPRELANRINGSKALERARQRDAWERTRWQTVLLMSMQVDKKHSKAVEKATRLPWDSERTENKVVALTPEQLARELQESERLAKKIAARGTSGS